MKIIINNLRLIIGDCLINIAMNLYPEGNERKSLCYFLNKHYRFMTEGK
jgi:hypothetical protein